ncbi:hypothetical protein EXIGLDRAFT_766303 [Exidia glandulosa HHB12029]|uniref:Uncharacterized protein n=1 Tax=Exidia glandulosa HHB12029 TaxID=1314781 RepID=A0A166AUY1_EXIGL|nr:hypothetical protein EXIGLDRAFT_766303 [Exidia glandulosa HHB12029]
MAVPHARALPSDFVKLGTSTAQFDTWHEELVDYLEMQGLGSYIDGVNTTWPPGGATAPTSAPSFVVGVTPEIRGTLPTALSKDPIALLDELRKLYRKDNPMSRVIMLKSLLTSKKVDEQSWDEQINRLTKIANQALDKPLTVNEVVSIAIILSAPPEWDTVINSCMQSCSLDEPSAFRVQLTTEETRRRESVQSQTEIHALAAQFAKKNANAGAGQKTKNSSSIRIARQTATD